MKKGFSVFLLLAMLLATCALAEQADSDAAMPSDEEQILAVYERMQQAMVDKDIDTLREMMGANTTVRHITGRTQTMDEWLSDIENALNRRGVVDYLFLKSQFVFFDFSEPLIFFLLDYLAIMGMAACLGYYLLAVLGKLPYKNRRSQEAERKEQVKNRSRKLPCMALALQNKEEHS